MQLSITYQNHLPNQLLDRVELGFISQSPRVTLNCFKVYKTAQVKAKVAKLQQCITVDQSMDAVVFLQHSRPKARSTTMKLQGRKVVRLI